MAGKSNSLKLDLLVAEGPSWVSKREANWLVQKSAKTNRHLIKHRISASKAQPPLVSRMMRGISSGARPRPKQNLGTPTFTWGRNKSDTSKISENKHTTYQAPNQQVKSETAYVSAHDTRNPIEGTSAGPKQNLDAVTFTLEHTVAKCRVSVGVPRILSPS